MDFEPVLGLRWFGPGSASGFVSRLGAASCGGGRTEPPAQPPTATLCLWRKGWIICSKAGNANGKDKLIMTGDAKLQPLPAN